MTCCIAQELGDRWLQALTALAGVDGFSISSQRDRSVCVSEMDGHMLGGPHSVEWSTSCSTSSSPSSFTGLRGCFSSTEEPSSIEASAVFVSYDETDEFGHGIFVFRNHSRH